MPGTTGPVYEVTHRVDPEIIDDFDAWLAAHIEEMLELPGIARVSVFIADDDEHCLLYTSDAADDLLQV